MRGPTLRLKVELLQRRVRNARSKAAAKNAVDDFAREILTDKRKRLTPEIERAILAAASRGMQPVEMETIFHLSPPTIRKVLKKGGHHNNNNAAATPVQS